jgi:butyryl-CoA dehydrogenase
VGAYALSEASSGSDAMSLRTRAVLSPDGQHYILNGEKMWITNGGFADVYTVFAKVDGEKFTAFLIERDTPGFAVGAEEHKLGIRGSSTCPLILTDCQVPVGNLLGELGKGHHIAFNILNIGRFKLGASAIGGAKNSLANAVRYAKERKAFGKTIGEFGLIQQKLAESATGIFVSESMAYRTIGMIDAALGSLEGENATNAREIQKKSEEYAVECSILKVWGSEMLDMVVDHTLQIYGGYGYVEEYPAERAYRDSRINRIFEGTNEINRLIITGWLMKRAAAGQLPLLGAIKKLMAEVMEPPSFDGSDDTDDPLAAEAALLSNLKKAALFCSGAATQKYMQALAEQQEIMGDLADMTMQVFALESALLRARKLGAQAQKSQAQTARAIVKLFAADALAVVEKAARRVLAAVAEGDMLRTQLAILRRLLKHTPENTIALSRMVAHRQLEAGGYKL